MIKKWLPFLFALFFAAELWAQKRESVQWGASFTSNGFYNATDSRANWINILQFDASASLWRGASIEGSLIAISNLREQEDKGGVATELPIFSAIEDPNTPLSLFLLSLNQQVGPFTFSIGPRNVNHDYFGSPCNSVFTSPTTGLFPCLANNYPLSDSPLAAMALHGEWRITPRITLKSSLYNGVASYEWDEVFRFRPHRDGIVTISELSYEGEGTTYVGHYHGGFLWANSPEPETGLKRERGTVWTLVEQPLYVRDGLQRLELLLHGGYSPDGWCDLYTGAGVVWKGLLSGDDALGLLCTRSHYEGGDEKTVELTYGYSWRSLTLKPALHRVFSTSGGNHTLLEMSVNYQF